MCLKAQHNRRYRRTRASIVVQSAQTSLLIDTSQDFREQVLENHIMRIDAVLYTHAHADHIYGLPDIRSYCRWQGGPVEIYGLPHTLQVLRRAFEYVFEPPDYVGGGIPSLTPHILTAPQRIGDIEVVPVPVFHSPNTSCQGYRLGNMAYLPDVKEIPPASLALLQDLDLLILNCLRHRRHGSHLSLEESLAYAQQLRPKRCLFTHMSHNIDHQLEEPKLPEWIRFAYDTQVVEI